MQKPIAQEQFKFRRVRTPAGSQLFLARKARLYSRVARGAKQAEEAPPYPRLILLVVGDALLRKAKTPTMTVLMPMQQKPTRSVYHFLQIGG